MGIPQAASSPARRRSDAGRVRLQQRDIDGLLLIADHYTAPHDLLAQALAASPARVRSIAARWRAAGYTETGVLCPLRRKHRPVPKPGPDSRNPRPEACSQSESQAGARNAPRKFGHNTQIGTG